MSRRPRGGCACIAAPCSASWRNTRPRPESRRRPVMNRREERPEELSWDGHRQSPARPYRRDIDGLRAVAVLSVIAFHVKFSAFPGGYIGVDVFFVISGYLIGSIILEEVGAGRFSLLAFYERRVRRIFPALAALLLLLSIPAYLYLLPNELAAYGGSVLAA